MSVIPFQERGEVAFVDADATTDLVSDKPSFCKPSLDGLNVNAQAFRDLPHRVKNLFHNFLLLILHFVPLCAIMYLRQYQIARVLFCFVLLHKVLYNTKQYKSILNFAKIKIYCIEVYCNVL